MNNNTYITPQEVSILLKEKENNFLLVDIREKDEFTDWNIKGSLNIPVNSFIASGDVNDVIRAFESIPKDRQIITICKRGINSQLVSSILNKMNYNTKYLQNGMMGWNRNFDIFEIPIDSQNLSKSITIAQFVRIGKGCLSYIVFHNASREAAVFDPSIFYKEYTDYINGHHLKVEWVIDTHSHADHFSGGIQLSRALSTNYYVNEKDMDKEFEDNSVEVIKKFNLGELEISVHSTPGHTDGSLSFLIDNRALVCGDLLLLESVGRPDLARSHEETIKGAEKLYNTINDFLLKQSDSVLILPAHFTSSTLRPVAMTLGELKKYNGSLLIKNKDEFVKYITEDIPTTPPNYHSIKRLNQSGVIVPLDYAEDLEIGPNRCAAK